MADRFQTTRWSVVLLAGREGEGSREALEWLCKTYWYPPHVFVRRHGHDADTAQGLTQSFFVSLLRERESALRRHPDNPAFRIDLDDAERRYSFERMTP